MTLLAIQAEIVARITAARIGSALRFALLDAADAVSRAIEAESRTAGARIEGNQPVMPTNTGREAGAEPQGNPS